MQAVDQRAVFALDHRALVILFLVPRNQHGPRLQLPVRDWHVLPPLDSGFLVRHTSIVPRPIATPFGRKHKDLSIEQTSVSQASRLLSREGLPPGPRDVGVVGIQLKPVTGSSRPLGGDQRRA